MPTSVPDDAVGGRPDSRTDWATARLRSDIMAGTLSPGTKLRTRDLSERYSISATPLREALQRLAVEGLVTTTPQHGARVAALDATELRSLYEVRMILEPTAVRRSIARAGDERLAQIADTYRAMAAAEFDDGYWELHNRFHALMRADCDSSWMLRFVEILRNNSERYRRFRAGTRFDQSRAEHEQLFRACQSRDADRVAELTTMHLESTLAAVLPVLDPGGPAADAT
jgi:GntR family transcriptional regulator, carbon starvation induced regulator